METFGGLWVNEQLQQQLELTACVSAQQQQQQQEKQRASFSGSNNK